MDSKWIARSKLGCRPRPFERSNLMVFALCLLHRAIWIIDLHIYIYIFGCGYLVDMIWSKRRSWRNILVAMCIRLADPGGSSSWTLCSWEVLWQCVGSLQTNHILAGYATFSREGKSKQQRVWMMSDCPMPSPFAVKMQHRRKRQHYRMPVWLFEASSL